MRGYFKILAAIPGFFLSSLFLMLLWRAIGPHFNLATIDYPMAMLMAITTWIVVAPLAAAAGHHHHGVWRSFTETKNASPE